MKLGVKDIQVSSLRSQLASSPQGLRPRGNDGMLEYWNNGFWDKGLYDEW